MATKDTAEKAATTTGDENRNYELMVLVQPELRESEAKKKLKELEDFIESLGGKISMKDELGKLETAYDIKGFDRALYVVYQLQFPGEALSELNQHLRIDKDIIRFLIISTPEGYEYVRYEEEAPSIMDEEEEKPKAKKAAPKASASAPKDQKDKDEGKEPSKEEVDKKLDDILG